MSSNEDVKSGQLQISFYILVREGCVPLVRLSV